MGAITGTGERDPLLSNALANSRLLTAGKYKGGNMSLTMIIFCSVLGEEEGIEGGE